MPYDQRLNAASFLLNTLMAVASNYRGDAPQIIDFSATDYHFSIHIVQQPALTLDIASQSLADVFSIAHHAQQMDDHRLVYLKSIVWFSEYCLVGYTSDNQIHKQMFLNGEPIGSPQSQPIDTSIGASLSFHFTLPTGIFESVIVDQPSLKAAIASWKKTILSRQENWKTIATRYHWRKTAEYAHNLQVIFTRKESS